MGSNGSHGRKGLLDALGDYLRERLGFSAQVASLIEWSVVAVAAGLLVLVVSRTFGLSDGVDRSRAGVQLSAGGDVVAGPDLQTTPAPVGSPDDPQQLAETIGQRLEQTLSHVAGVGTVEVQVTLAGGRTTIYASETTQSTSTTTERDAQGGERQTDQMQADSKLAIAGSGDRGAVVQKVVDPEVTGVLIVAEGATSVAIQAELARATQTLLDIPLYRIAVVAGK